MTSIDSLTPSDGATVILSRPSAPSTVIWQSMHDIGLATLFGSSLWNAVAQPLPHGEAPVETTPLAAAVIEAEERHRFRPVEYGAVAVTVISAVALAIATRRRRHAGTAVLHLALTGAAIGTAIWSDVIKRRLSDVERMAAPLVATAPPVAPPVKTAEPTATWPGDAEQMDWPGADEFTMDDAVPTPLDEAIRLERTARASAWTAAAVSGGLVLLDALSHARDRRMASTAGATAPVPAPAAQIDR